MGRVYLIGAGPGDPELLTLKAARLLEKADVVLHDSLVSREVLRMVRAAALVIDVGKRCGKKLLTQEEINALLVCYACSHTTVVRLKGGEPSVFARAGEEIEALHRAGVDFQIVPGVTAAFAAAAAARIPLTDRRVASQILFATFSRNADASARDWGALPPETTLVLYMPGPKYAEVANRLTDAGLPADLPCVVVSNASRAEQQIRWTSIGALAGEVELAAPTLMIVGRVASRNFDEWREKVWSGERIERGAEGVSVV
ncbi:MAG TPA: uroporphyrinogen-III C-methyltransferase [Candidatus Methylomirabilis sp.]|nr:uroporphyrinogen-III C-methyltransferase [Candidatus Methylomirabilis sp.]